MVNTRIRHHHKAQMLIEKAEMVQLARVGTTQQSSALLQRINQAIQPLQSRATVPQNTHNRLQFATPANLNHPMAYQTDLDPASMKNQSKRVQFRLKNIEKSVQELEEYSVSTPELRAALQIITDSTNVRAKKIEQQLHLYKEECMTKTQAIALFQSKKNSATFLERAMEIATNQVRTVIGSEVKSILKNEWHDMTKGVDQVSVNGSKSTSSGGENGNNNKNMGNNNNNNNNNNGDGGEVDATIVTPVELQLCFSQDKESPDFFNDLQNLLVRIVTTQQKTVLNQSAVVEDDDEEEEEEEEENEESSQLKERKMSIGKTMGIVNKVKNGLTRGMKKKRRGKKKQSGEGGEGGGEHALAAAQAAAKEQSKLQTSTNLQVVQLQNEVETLKGVIASMQHENVAASSTRENCKLDIEEHTRNIMTLNKNLQQLQANDAIKEDEFMSEREKLKKEYKHERLALDGIVDTVKDTAEDIRKTGLRMEQKVERVVSEAANKLAQSTKNEIASSITTLEVATKYNLEQTRMKLQNETRTKIETIMSKINKDESLLRECAQSLSTVEQLQLSTNELLVGQKESQSNHAIVDKKVNDCTKWINTHGKSSIVNKKKDNKSNQSRMNAIERLIDGLTGNVEKFKLDVKSNWERNTTKLKDMKHLLNKTKEDCYVSETHATDTTVKMQSLERTLKMNLATMKHSIAQVHTKDQKRLYALVLKVQDDLAMKNTHGIKRAPPINGADDRTMVHEPVVVPVVVEPVVEHKPVAKNIQPAMPPSVGTAASNETINGDNYERHLENIRLAENTSQNGSLSPWDEHIPMPLPLPLPVPRESTTDVLFRTPNHTGTGDRATGGTNATSDDNQSLWKAGGVPSHSMSMSKARQDRLSIRQQEQGSAVEASVTAAAAAAEMYKQGNDGSMLWSAPTSMAGSIGGTSTSDGMEYDHCSNRTTPLMTVGIPPRNSSSGLPPAGLQIHQVQDMMNEKIHVMSAKLGAHLHRIVGDSLTNDMKEMMSESHRTLLFWVKQEIATHFSAVKDSTAMAQRKDTVSENHLLKMEIQRREIKSRARKLIQPDPAAWQLKTLSEVEPLLEVVGNTSSTSGTAKVARLLTMVPPVPVPVAQLRTNQSAPTLSNSNQHEVEESSMHGWSRANSPHASAIGMRAKTPVV